MNIKLYPMALPCASATAHSVPEALYVRTTGAVRWFPAALELERNSTLSFDTWFGCFDYTQWRTFTSVMIPIACFRFTGTMMVECLVHTEKGDMLLYEQLTTGDGINPAVFPFHCSNLPENGFLFFRLRARSKQCRFLEGYYMADVPSVTPVTLAAITCTYQRESWVQHTINSFLAWQEKNGRLPLDFFIVDNGQTWKSETMPESQQLHLCSNQNTGGSGGFTKGIQESIKLPDMTHILLMDDDIILDWSCAARTIAFLSVLKPEYQDTLTVGGTMLDASRPQIQFEAGACCKNRALVGFQTETDLTDTDVLLQRSTLSDVNYAAWWYCCMPMAAVQKTGLPMPFFIKFDDVEYALRMQQQVVMLTGVCVWHENFQTKFAPWNAYYIARNGCITYSLHGQAKHALAVIKELCQNVLRLLLLYRYDTADFVLQGYQDFLRGWKWLHTIPQASLHQKILNQNAESNELFSIPRDTIPDAILQKPYDHCSISDCKHNCSIFQYNETTQKGFFAKRKNKRLLKGIGKLFCCSIRMLFTYRFVVNGFRKHQDTLCEESMWKKRNTQ